MLAIKQLICNNTFRFAVCCEALPTWRLATGRGGQQEWGMCHAACKAANLHAAGRAGAVGPYITGSVEVGFSAICKWQAQQLMSEAVVMYGWHMQGAMLDD
jgi:hypothetical protein